MVISSSLITLIIAGYIYLFTIARKLLLQERAVLSS